MITGTKTATFQGYMRVICHYIGDHGVPNTQNNDLLHFRQQSHRRLQDEKACCNMEKNQNPTHIF